MIYGDTLQVTKSGWSSTNQGGLVVDGITAVELELRLDLSVGAALGPPGGNAGVAAARELGTHASPGRQCRDGS